MTLDPIDRTAGTLVRLQAEFLDTAGVPVTGLSPDVTVQGSSDDKYLNAAAAWQAGIPAGGDIPQMTEANATAFPGLYYFEWLTTAKQFGVTYDVLFDGGATTANRYWGYHVFTKAPTDAIAWQKYLDGSAAPGDVEYLDPVTPANVIARTALTPDGTLHLTKMLPA